MVNEEFHTTHDVFQVKAIGYVRRVNKETYLEILAPFRPALKQLHHFSHMLVLWWANQSADEKSRSRLQTKPPYASEKLTGVFACRAEYRPNPIAVTTCKILDVDESGGVVHIANIDAYDETHIIDLKGYFPVCDRVKNARIPRWIPNWGEWLPEEGLGLDY